MITRTLEIEELAASITQLVEDLKQKSLEVNSQNQAYRETQDLVISKIKELNNNITQWVPQEFSDQETLEELGENLIIWDLLDNNSKKELADFNCLLLVYYVLVKKSDLSFVPFIATEAALQKILPHASAAKEFEAGVKLHYAKLNQKLLVQESKKSHTNSNNNTKAPSEIQDYYERAIKICQQTTAQASLSRNDAVFASSMAVCALTHYYYAKIKNDDAQLFEAVNLAYKVMVETNKGFLVISNFDELAFMLSDYTQYLSNKGNLSLAHEMHAKTHEIFRIIDCSYAFNPSNDLVSQPAKFYTAYGDFLSSDFPALAIFAWKDLAKNKYEEALKLTPHDANVAEKHKQAVIAFEQSKIDYYIEEFNDYLKQLDEGLAWSKKTENYSAIMTSSPSFLYKKATEKFNKALALGEKHPQFVIDKQLHAMYADFLLTDYTSIKLKSDLESAREVINAGLRLNPNDERLTQQLEQVKLRISSKQLGSLSLHSNQNKIPSIKELEQQFRCRPQQ